ncbi:MAG: hypothetical protein M1511_10510 [Deltaproteobacteria bacterium]|nr:hypothetical protein [Deltaproteobacteria bacterium]
MRLAAWFVVHIPLCEALIVSSILKQACETTEIDFGKICGAFFNAALTVTFENKRLSD